MQNIKVKVEKNTMTLTVDLTQRLGPSSSGKTTIIASTEGNAKIEGHEGLQYTPVDETAKTNLPSLSPSRAITACQRVSLETFAITVAPGSILSIALFMIRD